MANWIVSYVEIKADEDALETLANEFEEAFSSNPLNADWGNESLVNLLHHIGLSDDECAYGKIGARGWLSEAQYEDDCIYLTVETANYPQLVCIDEFCKHFVGDGNYDITYTAEDTNTGLFWTNDTYARGTVYVDGFALDDTRFANIRDYTDTKYETVVEELMKLLDIKEDASLEFLVNKANKVIEQEAEDEDAYLEVYPYKYVAIGDLRNLTFGVA